MAAFQTSKSLYEVTVTTRCSPLTIPYSLFPIHYSLLTLIIQHPSILRPPALRGIDDQRTLLERHARQAARHDLDAVGDQHIRPEIDVARGQPGFGEDRA